jgi:hypothetical protein
MESFLVWYWILDAIVALWVSLMHENEKWRNRLSGSSCLMVLVVPFYVAKRAPFAGDLNR